MTATEKLMQKIIFMVTGETVLTDIERRYNGLIDNPETEDQRCDSENELRNSGTPTGLEADYSRHYSSKAVAAEMLDGSWVGWTYWYGGGKHGEPSEMPWLECAYDVTTQVVMEPIRKFQRV